MTANNKPPQTVPKLQLAFIIALLCTTGCSSPQPQDTLGAIDIVQKKEKASPTTSSAASAAATTRANAPKSEEDVKSAYYDYIKNAPANDKSRRIAINRLAELEMSRLAANAQKNTVANGEAQNIEALKKAKALLQTALAEYPDAKDNDITLYQLARTQDQLGESEQSLLTLSQLCKKYPNSSHYAEAQFRIAEHAFMQGDYITAEAAYTELTFARNGETYLERALFKRGWTRYKQGMYAEAADDYLATIDKHQFGEAEKLSTAEKDQFNEYFRALGLSLANLASAQDIQHYLADKNSFSRIYTAYEVTSDIYLEQERYSDAATVLDQFIASNPHSEQVPFAHLKKITAWGEGNFKGRFSEAVAVAYSQYNSHSNYWNNARNSAARDQVVNELRHQLLRAANYAEEDYRQNRNPANFQQAKQWYNRYLEDYRAYAQQDKVYSHYAELLLAENQHKDALHYFELAAYDGNIVLDKEAAYATVVVSNTLYEQYKNNPLWLNKHIQYTMISAQLYGKEPRYQNAALHAAELALSNKRFDEALALANTLADNAADKMLQQANMVKGLAYLEKQSYIDAETIFGDLLKQSTEPKAVQNQLAFSIYQQAENDVAANRIDAAIQNFSRITVRAPDSEIAPKALYQAIALAMKHEQWHTAIGHIQQLQKRYPNSDLNKDATRQLSIAYLNAGDNAKAAQAFEQVATQEQNQEVKMASLWKAAELYESKRDMDPAIRSYSSYAASYTRPFPQYMEAMYKLTQLYQAVKDTDKVALWREKISLADKQAAKALKTDRTNYIAANIQLDIAKTIHSLFAQRQLIEPLPESLRAKKKLMQEAIAAYGQAASYDNPAITTEATFAIGNIYQHFSAALLKSERPRNLKGEELEQYNILIEDQAFPFEEKAIEFYEINMARTKEGISTPWIGQSHQELGKLFPARYNKKGKTGIYQ